MVFSPASSTVISASPVGAPVHALHVTDVDAVVAQRREQEVAALVGPDAPDHRHVLPEARGGDGLVGALAAGVALRRAAEHGLAGRRQPPHADHEVDVEAADDADAHPMRWSASITRSQKASTSSATPTFALAGRR